MLKLHCPIVVVLFTMPLVVGCGDDLASVQGTVTLDGRPVQGGHQLYGTVIFYRKEGGGAPAVAIIDGSGRYSLRTGGQRGISPGTYLVGIAVKQITPSPTPGGMPQARLITPAKYASVTQSGFREVVEPGGNTIDFDLAAAPSK